jgi:squalene synthase HpnC
LTLLAHEPSAAPRAEAVMARAQSENFPVASRLLPRRSREDLLAVYGFARLADELGDTLEGDRPAALDWLELELERAFAGSAEHPLMVRLQRTVARCSLTPSPFLRLIEANRQDQRKHAFATWLELREYCALSADPVGEIVLGVLGLATPSRIACSDSICTGLQLTEHCQDVAEDRARGRVYLPREDLEQFGADIAELDAAHAGPALREVLAFEVDRARALFREGRPLIAELRGTARIAIAAYAAGGEAALDAIERSGYDVLGGPPPVTRVKRTAKLLGTLLASRRAHR